MKRNQSTQAWTVIALLALLGGCRYPQPDVPAILERYADKLRNINSAQTEGGTALHESVTLSPGVGHFVAQVKPAAFNEALRQIIEDGLANEHRS